MLLGSVFAALALIPGITHADDPRLILVVVMCLMAALLKTVWKTHRALAFFGRPSTSGKWTADRGLLTPSTEWKEEIVVEGYVVTFHEYYSLWAALLAVDVNHGFEAEIDDEKYRTFVDVLLLARSWMVMPHPAPSALVLYSDPHWAKVLYRFAAMFIEEQRDVESSSGTKDDDQRMLF